MPKQAYKQKSAFSGGALPKVDNRSTSKKMEGNEIDEAIFEGMTPKLSFLPTHLHPGGQPQTDKLTALPSWLRAFLRR